MEQYKILGVFPNDYTDSCTDLVLKYNNAIMQLTANDMGGDILRYFSDKVGRYFYFDDISKTIAMYQDNQWDSVKEMFD